MQQVHISLGKTVHISGIYCFINIKQIVVGIYDEILYRVGLYYSLTTFFTERTTTVIICIDKSHNVLSYII